MNGASRVVLSVAATAGLLGLEPVMAHAQWWRSGPADFEACADLAEKAASKDEKAAKLSECNAKFAGRRKPGGGYTYFDFMQNRNFDIAGPNPTADEQKKIDEAYIAYLEDERRRSANAALTAKHLEQQRPQVQPASLKSEAKAARVPVPVASPVKQQAALSTDHRSRLRNANCAKGTFSCDWPRLSEGISDLKRIFTGSSASNSKGKKS